MKNTTIFMKAALLSLMMAFAMNLHSQNPTYSCVLKNGVLVNPTTFRFDIYIYGTGTIDLYLKMYQLAFRTTNTAQMINGGSLSGTYIAGSSELPAGFEPLSAISVSSIPPDYALRISSVTTPPGGALIPASGLRIGTFEVVNSVNYGLQPELAWSFTVPAVTIIKALVPPPSGNPTTITNPAFHSVIAGLEEQNHVNACMSVFPNPASSVITVVSGNEKKGNVKVFDVSGMLVFESVYTENKFTVDVSRLRKGVYFLKIENDSREGIIRFVKE